MRQPQAPHQEINSGRWGKPNTPRGGIRPIQPVTEVVSLYQKGVIWS